MLIIQFDLPGTEEVLILRDKSEKEHSVHFDNCATTLVSSSVGPLPDRLGVRVCTTESVFPLSLGDPERLPCFFVSKAAETLCILLRFAFTLIN